tara:strand:- start:286 stop:468 length:183 start_codon:yes stop_codon:yes gene_type:complete
VTKKEWLEQKIMCDEWGRPPSLADVPLTIMTRKDALIKQGGDLKSIDKLYKETINVKKEK